MGASDPIFSLADTPESPLAALTRHWMNERNAPDILLFQGDVLETILDTLHQQARMVEYLRADPHTTEEEHFRIILVQTEAERVKFLVRSYLRTRLHKVEKFAPFIMKHPEIQARLSALELDHAQSYQELTTKHYNVSVLDGLPNNDDLRSLEETFPDGVSMIQEPDKEQPVFVRARTTVEFVRLPDGSGFKLNEGSIHLLRYKTVETLVERGQVELI
jgi:GINS complex subunit 4